MPKSKESNEEHWWPKPQEHGDGNQLKPKEKRILQELIASQKLDRLNRHDNRESRN